MAEFGVRVYADIDAFAADWQALGYSATDTEQYWALLGELKPGELLIQIPDWLAEKKTGFVDSATPTAFVGTIAAETEQAIRVTESAAARPLIRHAHLAQSLETGIDRLATEESPDPDRLEWLKRRLTEVRVALDERQDAPALREEWLPKSQIEFIGRRAPEE